MQVQLPRPAQALYKAIGNPSVRLGAVAALALVAVWGMQASSASQDADLSSMLEVSPTLLIHCSQEESLVQACMSVLDARTGTLHQEHVCRTFSRPWCPCCARSLFQPGALPMSSCATSILSAEAW